MWWSEEHNAKTLRRAYRLARFTSTNYRSFITRTLDHTYDVATSIADAHDEQVFHGIFCHASTFAPSLEAWSQQCDGRRGLERKIVSTSDRAISIVKHRQHVLIACGTKDYEAAASVSQNLSRGNRLFARIMGVCDAAIAQDFRQDPAT
jgi:hypothetical protein